MSLTPSEPSEISAVRTARRDDIGQIAMLLVQLYDAELPGALVGSPASRQALLRFTLEADPEQSLHHRYVVCLDGGEVIATGMMQRPTEPDFERAPMGTLRQAQKLLGYGGAARLLVTVARSTLGVYRQKDPNTVLFHSVVVDKRQRERGLGRLLMSELERTAACYGCQRAVIQVLADNGPARRLYEQLGYQKIWQTPGWQRALTWSSCVMEKPLCEP